MHPGRQITDIEVFQTGLYTLPAPDEYLKCTPDYMLRYKIQGSPATIAIEIKCPYYGRNGTNPCADRACKEAYVLQTHLQMRALGCDTAWLVSWGPQETVVFRIKFCEDLWKMMSDWARRWFDSVQCPDHRADLPKQLKNCCQEVAKLATRQRWDRVSQAAQKGNDESMMG